MSKLLSVLLVMALVFSFVACGGDSKKEYKDGLYTTTASGHNGDLTVDVTISGGVIAAISLADHQETEGKYEPAVEGVVPAIIEKQSTKDVDVVAGSTETSQAIIKAVGDALKQAS